MRRWQETAARQNVDPTYVGKDNAIATSVAARKETLDEALKNTFPASCERMN
jgi:hypothetical protein